MRRILVTDSTADIPENLSARYNIKVLPVNIILDGKRYRDGEDVSRSHFYGNFAQFSTMSSAPIQYEDYGLEYIQLCQKYDEIIIIHCSQYLSATYATAKKVVQDFPNTSCRVAVIDSGQCSMGLGLIVLEAARAMAQGKVFDEIIQGVHQKKLEMCSYMAVPTLKYLKKNKKIGGLRALFGSAVGVKPVLEMNHGKMVIKSKLFGEQKNMILTMLESIKQDVADRPISLAIIYAGNSSIVQNLHDVFQATFTCKAMHISRFSPSVAINTGPESYAVFFAPYQQ